MNCGSSGGAASRNQLPMACGNGSRGFSILRHCHRLSAKRSVGALDMVRAMAMDGWPRATPYVAAGRHWGDIALRTGAARRGRLEPSVGEQASVVAGAARWIMRDDEAGVMAVVGPAIVVMGAGGAGLRRCRRGHEGEARSGKCRKATQREDTHAVSLLTGPDVSNIRVLQAIRAQTFDLSFTLIVNRQSAGPP